MLKLTKHLTPNKFSRPQRPLKDIKGLVLHWVANPKTTPEFNWQYWEDRKLGKTGYGSGHVIIGIDGTILEAIPPTEMAYHVGAQQYTPYALAKYGTYPNNCTLSAELCHVDWEGNLSDLTWIALVEHAAEVCEAHRLDPFRDITTHTNIVGSAVKECPRIMVKCPDLLQQLQLEVSQELR